MNQYLDNGEDSLPSPLARIYRQQENLLFSRIAAVQATQKPELIGAELEDAIRSALHQILPGNAKVTTGFVIRPDGTRSSHFDGIVYDARYSLLGALAGNALVPLHAVVAIIEIKTTLTAKALREVDEKSLEVEALAEWLQEDLAEKSDQRAKDLAEIAARFPWHRNRRSKLPESGLSTKTFGIRFFALSMRSSLAQHVIASYLWKPFFYDIMILRAKQTFDPSNDTLRTLRFGPAARSSHFFKQLDPSTICIRSTRYLLGYFLQTVVQMSLEVIHRREYGEHDVATHLDAYLEYLVDIDRARQVARFSENHNEK